jgi:excisionase family DNA binding protein
VQRTTMITNVTRKSHAERESKKWLNVREAAAHIGMSVGFVRKAVRSRAILHSRVGTKALRFDCEALDEWLAVNSCGGEAIYPKS